MKRSHSFIFLIGLLVFLSLARIVLAASGPAIGWNVISGGGAPASGGAVTLNATLGQPVVGSSTGGDVSLGAGYWYGLGYDETQCGLAENTPYAFNQTWPVSVTLQAKGNLECLRVRRFDQNHADRTGDSILNGVGWGRYWSLTPTDSLGDPASGFSLTLTLPNEGFTAPRSCRYPGEMGGSGWDCDDGTHTTFTASTVTRSGITSLSDWAVGNDVGPTAVSVRAFRATGPLDQTLTFWGLLIGVLLVSLILAQQRKTRVNK